MSYTSDKKIKSVEKKPKYGLSILLLLSFIYFIPFLSELSAQTKKTVKGIVTELNGDPIIGANVTILGSSIGTITTLDGSFNLSVPANATLKVTYIGYESQEIAIKTKDFLRISLREDSKSLDEVVVIGYGTSTKRDLTSAVSKVDISSVQNVSVASVNEALAGRMAGVQVTSLGGKPGEAVEIVIRGANSITSNSSPLYVIDGFVMTDDYINTINPNDIESLEVLKDASATSIYGAR
ncbi:MAG: TonB-dependent receptor plug domain-containing protein, partial [Paludibacter sp.]